MAFGPKFRRRTGRMLCSRTNLRRVYRKTSMDFLLRRGYINSLLFHGRYADETHDWFSPWRQLIVPWDISVVWSCMVLLVSPALVHSLLVIKRDAGNGKTISIKAIMKSCDEKGFRPLYVKSFQSKFIPPLFWTSWLIRITWGYKGEEGAMADVFDKARQLSPCVVVLEDLDSLINDRNRSFFLNQLDGLESNDGLLVIGTTNHFEKLDPGLSARPSRFDRK